jgi:hypothetical protein
MIMQIQEIFTFRELLGVTCSFDSSIIVREKNKTVYPISFYEPNMTNNDKSKIIPNTVLEKWFNGTSIDDVTKRLLKIHDINNLSMILHKLRGKIEEVIQRVDRNAISYKTFIITRITERLQTALMND